MKFFSNVKWGRKIAFGIILAMGLLSGCGGSGGSKAALSSTPALNIETGSYKLDIAWPDTGKKLIPDGSTTISVVVVGEGMDEAVFADANLNTNQIRIDNLPVGKKGATIKAFDASSNLLAVRDEYFEIESGQTTNSTSIPLGIVVFEDPDTGSVSCNPSMMFMTGITNIPVQNFTTKDISFDLNGDEVTDLTIPAMSGNVSTGVMINSELIRCERNTALAPAGGFNSGTLIASGFVCVGSQTYPQPNVNNFGVSITNDTTSLGAEGVKVFIIPGDGYRVTYEDGTISFQTHESRYVNMVWLDGSIPCCKSVDLGPDNIAQVGRVSVIGNVVTGEGTVQDQKNTFYMKVTDDKDDPLQGASITIIENESDWYAFQKVYGVRGTGTTDSQGKAKCDGYTPPVSRKVKVRVNCPGYEEKITDFNITGCMDKDSPAVIPLNPAP